LHPTTVTYGRAALDAANAHDTARQAALYAEDATSGLAGDEPDHGRAAIQKRLETEAGLFKESHLKGGRKWVGRDASVLEYVFAGTRRAVPLMGAKVAEHPVGVYAAAVVTFDAAGLVKTERAYFDAAAPVGQIDPRLLPKGFDKVRPIPLAAPAGTAVLEPRGTPAESHDLDVMNMVYLAFDAHAIEEALALFADDFVLEDYAAPAPQRKADVRKHAREILAAIPDFHVVRTLVFPAGGDVVVESSVEGTFKAAMGAVPPTGQPVKVHQLDVWRLADGKVARQWSYSNQLEVLAQLGVLKAPAQ
jgi:steroid delta-isomerase-like uncharacterized protein